MMDYYCIGHVLPAFSIPQDFSYVGPVVCDKATKTIVITCESLGEAFNGRFLSEYTQLFGLADMLGPRTSGSLYLFQYRKFISLQCGTRKSTNIPYAYASLGDEAEKLFPNISELNTLSSEVMVGPIIRIRSTAANYSQYHLVEDFAAFCHALGTLSILSASDISRFINYEYLIPAPSLGLYPYKLFYSHMQILRQAWARFHEIHFLPRDDYQRRVGGFLLERLHSFLILDALQKQQLRAHQGHQIIISDAAHIRSST